MNPIRATYLSIKNHLSASQKRQMIWLAVLIFFQGVLDVFSLSLIIPILKLASDPTLVTDNKYYLGDIYNNIGFSTINAFLLFILFSVLFFYLIKTLFGLLISWVLAKFTTEVAVYITNNQYDKYYSLSFLDFINIKSSTITMNVYVNPGSYVTWIINPLIIIFSELIIVMIIVTAIAVFNFTLLAFIFFTVAPVSWLIYRSLKNKSNYYGIETDKLVPVILNALNNAIFGYIDVKLGGKEKDFREKYIQLVQRFHDMAQKFNFIGLIPMRGYEISAMLGIMVIFIYKFFIETQGSVSAVFLICIFAGAAYRLLPSMNRIMSNLIYIKRCQNSIEILDAYNDLTPAQSSETEDIPVKFINSIEFKNISYRFNTTQEYILKNINLLISKGDKVGLIGASGSGKTTLINILLRFIKEESGEVLVDGVKLSDHHLNNWRKHLGYVKQDIFILDGSIKENIVFGDTDIDKEKLNLVLQQASLSEFVSSLPQGIDTLVGEKGNRLSGGQKQRIGIARALYRDAEILVFDEATSALDNETEADVTEAIDKLSRTDKTIFLVAHRVTTLKNCNRIFEIKNGMIESVPGYEKLIERML